MPRDLPPDIYSVNSLVLTINRKVMTQKDSDRLGQRFKMISADLKLYIEKRIELLLLNIGEQASKWMAISIQKISGVLLLVGGLICLLVALAIFLGDLLNNPALGYVIVSVPLFALGYLLVNLKPESLLENLKQHFESELIESLEGSKEKNELPEPLQTNVEEK